MSDQCAAGDWVEIESVLLEPGDRSPSLPAETADKPLVMWVKGFAMTAADVGAQVEIETMTGRHIRGRLVTVDPGYTHTFGPPPRELARVGRDLRGRIAAWRAKHGGSASGSSGGPR
ncbi:MAG: 2-amino-4-oxopentanoate thiolase subunit OrtA [Actinomycetota bacterium]|nr:2-amino-4-oxopentanoate thiolase subunit OrtA [Actinomycetota bacterium]